MMVLPPAVVVHGLDHARVALAAGVPVTLLSGAEAGLYAGAGWWRALIVASGTAGPDILDCGDAPGRAMEALHTGCRLIVLDPAVPAWSLVAARAAVAGAVLLDIRPLALDMGVRGAGRRLAVWLNVAGGADASA